MRSSWDKAGKGAAAAGGGLLGKMGKAKAGILRQDPPNRKESSEDVQSTADSDELMSPKELNFYLPISLVEQNMETAKKREALHNEKFWWRCGKSGEIKQLYISEILFGREPDQRKIIEKVEVEEEKVVEEKPKPKPKPDQFAAHRSAFAAKMERMKRAEASSGGEGDQSSGGERSGGTREDSKDQMVPMPMMRAKNPMLHKLAPLGGGGVEGNHREEGFSSPSPEQSGTEQPEVVSLGVEHVDIELPVDDESDPPPPHPPRGEAPNSGPAKKKIRAEEHHNREGDHCAIFEKPEPKLAPIVNRPKSRNAFERKLAALEKKQEDFMQSKSSRRPSSSWSSRPSSAASVRDKHRDKDGIRVTASGTLGIVEQAERFLRQDFENDIDFKRELWRYTEVWRRRSYRKLPTTAMFLRKSLRGEKLWSKLRAITRMSIGLGLFTKKKREEGLLAGAADALAKAKEAEKVEPKPMTAEEKARQEWFDAEEEFDEKTGRRV